MSNEDTHYATPEATEGYARQMDFQIAEYDSENRRLRAALDALLDSLNVGEISDEYEAVEQAEALLKRLRKRDN